MPDDKPTNEINRELVFSPNPPPRLGFFKWVPILDQLVAHQGEWAELGPLGCRDRARSALWQLKQRRGLKGTIRLRASNDRLWACYEEPES